MPSDLHRTRPRRRPAIIALVGMLVLAGTCATAWAAFTGSVESPNNEFRAAPDWVAPTVEEAVIQKIQGGIPGYIRPGGGYRINAVVSDSGNPSSGITSVNATLSAGPAPLGAGEFSIAERNYNYRSQTITAPSSLSVGTQTYPITSVDGAENVRTQSGFSVIVDSTAATATAVATTNKAGGILGRAELGDSATLTYSEIIDPNSVIAGWTGAATNVVVRIDNNVLAYGGSDALTIYNATNSAALPLGTIDLNRTDFVGANVTFGATGTPSLLTLANGVATVVLGTASGATTTSSSNTTTVWFPAAGATDRAGNPTATTTRTEAGTADREF
jgi:hypothetical protein